MSVAGVGRVLGLILVGGEKRVKAVVRRVLLELLRWLGVIAFCRFLHRYDVVILMLHGVMDDRDGQAWTPLRSRLSRERLRRQLRALSGHYRFVSLSEAVSMLSGQAPLKPKTIVLTFDDGYRNQMTHALPILRECRAPMTIFVPTGKVGERRLFAFDRLDYALQGIQAVEVSAVAGASRHAIPLRPRSACQAAFSELRARLKSELGADLESCGEMRSLIECWESLADRSLELAKDSDEWAGLVSWEDIERLAADEDVEIGSHTVDHVQLALADPMTIWDELRRSKKAIEERTGRSCGALSYPCGNYDASVVAIARQAGYTCGVTADDGFNRPGDDVMTLRRIAVPVEASVTELLARVSGLSEELSRLKSVVIRLKMALREGPE